MSANPRSLKRTSRGSKMVEYRCDLCKRNFTHAHALQMHIETSGAHAKSRQPATNYQARTAPKTQAAGQVVSSGSIVMPPNRHEPANQQNSTRHDNVRKRGIMEDLPYHSQRAPYQGPAAFNRNYSRERMQPWCSVCDREFYTEMGFQRHINTSREHKENLEKDSSRESSVQSNSSQYRPEVTVASMLSKPEMHGSGHQQATANMTFTQMQVPAIGVEGDTFGMPNLMSWNSSAWQIDFVPPSMTYMAHESRPQPARSVPNISYPHGQPWSDVPFPIHQWVLELLWMNCHTLERLSHSGYRLRQETEKEIDRFRKCRNCGVSKRNAETNSYNACIFHPKPTKRAPKGNGNPRLCPNCGKEGMGCITLRSHDFAPAPRKPEEYKRSPPHRPGSPAKRAAVVLDCEMVGVGNGRSEAVQVCAVDFLTGEVLVDTYVIPNVQVFDWRTRVSGVSRGLLMDMKQRGRTLDGWEKAREMLWNYVDDDTVLIGQALSNDLDVLRMVHLQIVDSALLTKDTVELNCGRTWGLKVLCKKFLGIDIQTSKGGHVCLEDTFSAREIVLWCLRHPDRLQAWALLEREILKKERAAREAKRKIEKEKKAREDEAKNAARQQSHVTSIPIVSSDTSDCDMAIEDYFYEESDDGVGIYEDEEDEVLLKR